MKNICFISALAFVLCLSSCGTLAFNDNLAKVVEGMSQNDVSGLLGSPTHRRFDQGIEEWEYVRAYSSEQNRIVLIGFTDGRVTAMDSFYVPIGAETQGSQKGNPPHRGKNPRH